MLKHIMGKSNADRMVECMEVIQGRWVDDETKLDIGHEVTLEDKLRAWDDMEMVSSSHRSNSFSSSYSSLINASLNKQLIEDLDNANG
jgi:hypothetical protein